MWSHEDWSYAGAMRTGATRGPRGLELRGRARRCAEPGYGWRRCERKRPWLRAYEAGPAAAGLGQGWGWGLGQGLGLGWGQGQGQGQGQGHWRACEGVPAAVV